MKKGKFQLLYSYIHTFLYSYHDPFVFIRDDKLFLHALHGKLLPARYLQILHRRKLEKLGVIWEKDRGIMDKLGGIVDKLGDIRDKLAGTIFKKQKFQTLYSCIPAFLYSNHNFLHDLHVLHGKSRLKNGAQSAHFLVIFLNSMTYKFRAGTKRCQKCTVWHIRDTVWHIRDTIWHTRGAILHLSAYCLRLSAYDWNLFAYHLHWFRYYLGFPKSHKTAL